MRPGEGERLQRAREAVAAAFGEGEAPGATGDFAGAGGPPPGLEPALSRLRALAGGPPVGARAAGPVWRRGLRRLLARVLRFETWWLRESDRAAAEAIAGVAGRVEEIFGRLERLTARLADQDVSRDEAAARDARETAAWRAGTAAALADLADGQRRLGKELAALAREAERASRKAGAETARQLQDMGRALERTRAQARQAGDRIDKLHRGLLEAANRVARLENERATRSELQSLSDGMQTARAALEEVRVEGHRLQQRLGRQGERLDEQQVRMDRGASDLAAASERLDRSESRLDDLAAARRLELPELDAASFMARFRGSEDEIRRRLRRYVDLLAASPAARQGPILEIGCGRGEFLDLCREAGLPARAIEIDPALAAPVLARGHQVAVADAISELQAAGAGTLGAVFSAQVIEHLAPGAVTRLVATAHAALRSGGLLILETLNPASLSILATTFYRDPGHRNPLHPDTAAFLLESAGFRRVRVVTQSPVPAEHALEPLPPGGDEEQRRRLNRNLGVLNDLLFGPQEYHVVGERP